MAQTKFSGPVKSDNGFIGDFTGNVVGAVQFPTYTVANAPSAASIAGTVIYVSNGAAGAPVLAFSNGTNWLRVDTLATISAT